jgi:glycosyltransferase involved in cell wall biosynthesis
MHSKIPDIRVVLDHQIFAGQKYGGISRYLSSMVPLLSDYGCDAKIVAPLYINSYLRHVPRDLVVGMPIPQFRGAGRLARAVDDFLARPLARALGARVVHETYYKSKLQVPRNASVVLTVHDMIHELFPNTIPDQNTIERKACAIARADRIICISESTRQDLLRFFPEVESRISVILHGFGEELSISVKPMENSGRPYILHVGPRSAYKNFSALLEAFAQSPRLRTDFDLVCIGGGKWTPSETDAIRHHSLKQSVRQCHASDAELKRWFRGAEVFVYPSIYEGFGLSPLEAMAANCPVVAVRASSIPEVCGTAAELAEEGSSEALRAAIEAVVYSPTRANELRGEGQTRLTHFSWDRTAAETAAVYREIA